MSPQETGLTSWCDERTHRIYEGVVVDGNDPLGPNGQLDLDHGFEVTPSGRKTHVWTDSSCWLKDLSGKKVRITVAVVEDVKQQELHE